MFEVSSDREIFSKTIDVNMSVDRSKTYIQ